MSKKSLAHYQEFQTNWKELRKLPENRLAVLAVLQFAVSETNALSKIYICQDHELSGDRAVDSAVNIHRFTILRIWSSKLFEAIQFIKDALNGASKGDQEMLLLLRDANEQFEKISKGDGFHTARDLRNEAANHYSFKAAKKNLPHVPVAMDFNMYLAESQGNEFFPLGEAVMFHARLNRRWAVSDKNDQDQKFRDWLDWNILANDWLSITHASFVGEFVFKALGRNGVQRRSYWVSDEFAANHDGKLTPIYFQARK